MKRIIDILIAFGLLILTLPLWGLLIFLIKWKLGAPVFFKQQRPGLYGKAFMLYKFRTMIDIKDSMGNQLSDEIRLTALGKVLRKLSVDELPQLINVIKGELSLVGPRPLLMDYIPLYTKEQFKRHDVKPGITGWAQINGRNNISWEEKFKLDVWYVENHTIWLDLKILVLTFLKVLRADGINKVGNATMEPFSGNVNIERRDNG